LEGARKALGPTPFEAAWREARSVNLQDAFDFALESQAEPVS
jgi:hypothetical protein